LEDVAFTRITRLFQTIFRTKGQDPGGLNKQGDNSNYSGVQDWDENAKNLIKEIREKAWSDGKNVLCDCDGEFLTRVVELLGERAKPPRFDEGPEEFAKKNPGRLVSKFLLSYMAKDE